MIPQAIRTRIDNLGYTCPYVSEQFGQLFNCPHHNQITHLPTELLVDSGFEHLQTKRCLTRTLWLKKVETLKNWAMVVCFNYPLYDHLDEHHRQGIIYSHYCVLEKAYIQNDSSILCRLEQKIEQLYAGRQPLGGLFDQDGNCRDKGFIEELDKINWKRLPPTPEMDGFGQDLQQAIVNCITRRQKFHFVWDSQALAKQQEIAHACLVAGVKLEIKSIPWNALNYFATKIDEENYDLAGILPQSMANDFPSNSISKLLKKYRDPQPKPIASPVEPESKMQSPAKFELSPIASMIMIILFILLIVMFVSKNDLEKENDALKKDIHILKKKNQESKGKIDNLEKENDALEKENDALEKENGELKKENDALKKDIHILKKKNQESKGKIANLEKDNGALRKENDALKKDINGLKQVKKVSSKTDNTRR